MSHCDTEPFYVGNYRHRLDAKNRVTIPSKWRFRGDDADIYLAWAHPDGYVAVYPPRKVEEFRQKIRNISESDPRGQRILRQLFGRAQQFGCDRQGRVKIPDDLVERTRLTKDVALVGLGETFNLWSAQRYEEMEKEDFDLLAAMRDFGI